MEWRRPAEEGGGGKPPLECVQNFVRYLTRRQGAADDGKRPLRRLRVAVAKLKGGDLGGMARERFPLCGFNGYDGASEGPFSLFEGPFSLLGALETLSWRLVGEFFCIFSFFCSSCVSVSKKHSKKLSK